LLVCCFLFVWGVRGVGVVFLFVCFFVLFFFFYLF